jgi:cation:H+ antiporter
VQLWQWVAIFLAGSGALVWAGVTLARSGDEIATRTGLGGLLVGTLLVAAATSLPEIVTTVSAAAGRAPDLAVGSVFGSSMANMAILGVIDLIHRKHVWTSIELGHVRVGLVAVALTALAVFGVVTPGGVHLGWLGGDSGLILVGYVASVAWMRRSPRGSRVPAGRVAYPAPTEWATSKRPGGAVRGAVRRFVLATLAIVAAGPVVALSGEGVATTSGIGETFVGVLFVSVATSLPELLGTVGAVRIGAYDLAVGNLFGSNAFNLVTLFFADLAYTGGPLLMAASTAQAVAGIAAIGLMAVALAAIVHGEETRISRLEPDAILLLLVYVGALIAVWTVSR